MSGAINSRVADLTVWDLLGQWTPEADPAALGGPGPLLVAAQGPSAAWGRASATRPAELVRRIEPPQPEDPAAVRQQQLALLRESLGSQRRMFELESLKAIQQRRLQRLRTALAASHQLYKQQQEEVRRNTRDAIGAAQSLREEAARRAEEIQRLQSSVERKQAEVRELIEQRDEGDAAARELRDRHAALQNLTNGVQQQLAEALQAVEEERQRTADLQSQVTAFAADRRAGQALIEELEAGRRNNDQLRLQTEALQEESARLREALAEAHQHQAAVQNRHRLERTQLEEERVRLAGRLRELEQHRDALQRGAEQHGGQSLRLQEELAAERLRTEQLERDAEQLQRERDEQQQLWNLEHAGLARRAEALQQATDEFKLQLAAAQGEAASLREQLTESLSRTQSAEVGWSRAREEAVRLQDALRQEQSSRAEQGDQLRRLEDAANGWDAERRTLQGQLAEQNQKATRLAARIDSMHADHAAMIRELEAELRTTRGESLAVSEISERRRNDQQRLQRRAAAALRRALQRLRQRRRREAALEQRLTAENHQQQRLRQQAEALAEQWEERLAGACEAIEQSQRHCRELEASRETLRQQQRRLQQDLAAATASHQHLARQVGEMEGLRRKLASTRQAAAEAESRWRAAEERLAESHQKAQQAQRLSEQRLSDQQTLERQAVDLQEECRTLRTQCESWKARLRSEAAERRKLEASLRRAAQGPQAAVEAWRSHEQRELRLRIQRLTEVLNATHRRAIELRNQARRKIQALQQLLESRQSNHDEAAVQACNAQS